MNGKGSNLYGGKTLIDIIEQQKIEDRKQYQRRQELKRQEKERAAASRKAAERTPYEKILDKQEEAKQLINSIQVGSPRNDEYIIAVLKRVYDVLDYCLSENKPGHNPDK